ncbi:hypothetical protein [Lacticaseibacillus paracasei]|jgi:hypothetical protein|uniref:hypothetical protein n=1 Tax=Lacticaseibacillus paracasei TaxID=1597 RepID=UPI00136E6783|nr:hypothetical protein [Lacticaseibacillus paracasei]MBM6413523.1 hypothetical protein [Lacticaseibacillus paracasei]MXI83361.1 hypothetical protein [Lacticaseibacillus paracasei]WNX22528.1 hypothetical protein RWA18_03115 [Lacticaseibacillus paracasei]
MSDNKYKSARVYFYQMALGKRTNRDSFRKSVLDLWKVFEKKQYSKVPEFIIDDNKVYVSSMEKVPLGDQILPGGKVLETFALMMNIQRVNPNEPVRFGDLTMRPDIRLKTLSNELEGMQKDSPRAKELMKQIDDGNIGPLINSPVLYDPFRRILLRVRQSGDLTNQQLMRFFKRGFNCPGAFLQMILDGQSTTDIDGLDLLLEFSYAVASPDNFSAFANNAQSEFKDLEAASDMNSQTIKVVMMGPDLTKRKAKKKIDELLSTQSGLETKTAVVKGIADGSEKEMDFIKNRLKYDGTINYDSKKGITIKDYFNLLSWAYQQKMNFLKARYNLEWD